MYANPVASKLYYEESYVLGLLILFGIATYLGTYVLSLFIKKAVFAVAAGIHIVLFVVYLVSYVIAEAAGAKDARFTTYSNLQYGLGLLIPAANLGRESNPFHVSP